MSADPKLLAGQAARELLNRFNLPGIDIAIVLGSGWAAGADLLGATLGVCELRELPGFANPVVTGQGQALRVLGTESGRVAAVFTGRTHLYEGLGVAPVVHAVRTAAAAGAKTLVLTNGCGGLDPDWAPGTPVLIRDHINLSGATPLTGPTFIDMSQAYSPRLRDLARQVDPSLAEGVYVQFHGPAYETPAEVRMARVLGGDLVGMSTAVETIAAREAGLEVLGLSLVTNAAAGVSGKPLDHAEVIAAGLAAAPRLLGLLAGILRLI